jgi:hypothetical protein
MRGRIPYSKAEMKWLEKHRAMIISDYHAAFCAAFGRSDVAAIHLHSLRKRKGWKVGRIPGRFVGRKQKRRMPVSDAEVAWLRKSGAVPISECHRQFCVTFSRADLTAEQLHSLRKREGCRTGRTGHFAKGAVPANKGKKMPYNSNSARTRFKPCQLPHNTKHDGHERIDKQTGFVLVRVSERNPWTGGASCYLPKQIVLWRKKHGAIPGGMVLKCKGDKLNTDPSNWELIPRGMLPRLNNRWGRDYDSAPAEVKPTIMAVAKLEHALTEKRRSRC